MDKIIVEHKVKKRICDELNVSYGSVYLALLGVRDTELCRRIREKALGLGGIEVSK